MSLRDLGLLPQQETLYRLLLAEPSSTIEQLAQRSGSDVDTVLADLDGLSALALTFSDHTMPCGVVARRPAVALGRLAEQRATELSRQMQAIIDTQADIIAIDELATGPNSARSAAAATDLAGVPGFEVLHGRPAISQRLDELALETRESLDSITPAPPRGPTIVGTGMSMRRSANHGVRIRWVLDPRTLTSAGNADAVRETLQAGAGVRAAEELMARLIIADATSVMVPIDIDHKDDGALVITHPLVVQAMRTYFDQVWRRSKTLELVHGEPAVSNARTAQDELDLLVALADHSTDETAARAAGLSDRQFRRRLNSAMTALGAQNRFQAGVLAERQGLLDHSAPAPRPSFDQAAGSGGAQK